MSLSKQSPELQSLCQEYLADIQFHQSFLLAPSRITTRKTSTPVTFCDAGCRTKADGSRNTAAVLFIGGMFAGRWLGTMLDVVAQKLGVRLLSVDRPGMGGTPDVDIEHRVQTWLEIVPALLAHLNLKHVALVSHSAGTIYLLNTLLHLRQVLHPVKPYVAMLAPWIHHADSSSLLMSLTRAAPLSCISSFHRLTGFMLTSVMPSVGPMFTFSGNIAARVGSSFPSMAARSSPQTDATTWVMQPGTATAEEVKREREVMADLRVKYVLAETIAGGSQEALLCLKRPENYWGSWDNYDNLVPMLVAQEKEASNRRWSRGSFIDGISGFQHLLKVDVFFAENDRLTNGKKGAKWFDDCWRADVREDVIDYQSETIKGQNHESVIDPDLIDGPLEKVFMLVAKSFNSLDSRNGSIGCAEWTVPQA